MKGEFAALTGAGTKPHSADSAVGTVNLLDCLERMGMVGSGRGRISGAVGQAAVTVPVTSFQVVTGRSFRGGIRRRAAGDGPVESAAISH